MSDRRDDEPSRHETTIIQTGERSGGGGMIIGLVALLMIAVLGFLFFGGYLSRAVEGTDVNVNVTAPNIELPDVQVTPPAAEPTNKSN